MTVHYGPKPTPGFVPARRRTLCGVIGVVGYDVERHGTANEHGERLGATSSNLKHVTCKHCRAESSK